MVTVIVYYNGGSGETYVGVRPGKLTDEQKDAIYTELGYTPEEDEDVIGTDRERSVAIHEFEDGEIDLHNIWEP